MTRFRAGWLQWGPYLAFGTALAGMLGSLYYSEIAGFPPCTLCWYQRIAMYPITVIALVGILKRDRGLAGYVLPLSIAGMLIAVYHYLLELGVLPHSAVCSLGVPCDVKWVSYFGFVTIPLLSLAAFAIISVAMILYRWANHDA